MVLIFISELILNFNFKCIVKDSNKPNYYAYICYWKCVINVLKSFPHNPASFPLAALSFPHTTASFPHESLFYKAIFFLR